MDYAGADSAGNGNTRDAPSLGALGNSSRGFAEGGLEIDLALGGDDQVGATQLGVEPNQVQNQIRTATKRRPENGVQPGPESTSSTPAREAPYLDTEVSGDALRQMVEPRV